MRLTTALAALAALLMTLPAAQAAERPRFEITTDEAFDPAAVAAYAGHHPEIYARIDADLPAHLENLRRWVRQRSISAQNDGVLEMAGMLRADLEAMGFAEAELGPHGRPPRCVGLLRRRRR